MNTPLYVEEVQVKVRYIDALADPNLSVAAKALWIAILSQECEPGSVDYFEDLVPEDTFYEALMELKRKGYFDYED